MESSYAYPKLRWPLDVRIERIDTEELLFIRCPLGISQEPLLLISAVAPVVVSMDGSLSFQQLLDKHAARGLSQELLVQLLQILDKGLFLANEKFARAEKQLQDEFRSLDVRPPALAGLSYPAEGSALRVLLDSYCQAASSQVVAAGGHRLVALVAPHIDYGRGGECYGRIFPYLAATDVDLYLVMGTSHQGGTSLFQLTRKHFASPLGTLQTDRAFIDGLAKRYGTKRAFADEFLHKREHSIELQIPFIAHFKPQATLAPILVGGFHELLASARAPEESEEYETFVSALVEQLQLYEQQGKTWCIIAGVDMAHIGRAFGDAGQLTQEIMEEIATKDYEYLAALLSGDKISLYQHVVKDLDARRICGFPTIYTVLDLLRRMNVRVGGSVVDYRQAVDYTSDCAVTFGGVSLFHLV